MDDRYCRGRLDERPMNILRLVQILMNGANFDVRNLSAQNVAESEEIWAITAFGRIMRHEKFQKPEHSHP